MNEVFAIRMATLLRSHRFFRAYCNIGPKEATDLTFRYKTRPHKDSRRKLIQHLCDCSRNQAFAILKTHPALQTIDLERISSAAEVLRVSSHEIRDCPKVLGIYPVTIEHHSLVLKESGFDKLSPLSIVHYTLIAKKKIYLLKAHGLLPEDANVVQNFLDSIKAPKDVCKAVKAIPDVDSDDNSVSFLRDIVLKCYLQRCLGASKDEVEFIFSTYVRVLHKSLHLIRKTLSFLLNELQFPKEHITKHGFVLYAHPDDLKKIVETVPYLAGTPIQDILRAHPTMATTSYKNFTEIIKVLREAGISEEFIVRVPVIFNISPQTLKERLPSLDPRLMTPDLKAFTSDPRMLRLLIHYDIINQRANFLNNQDRTSDLPHVASLSLLIGTQTAFERFVNGVGGQSRGSDVVNYLISALKVADGKELTVTPSEIRATLSKNPNWRSMPLSEIQACFTMLKKNGYKPKEILSAIHIILYPSQIVQNQLNRLSMHPEILDYFQLTRQVKSHSQGKCHVKSDEERSGNNLVSDKELKDLVHKYSLLLCLYFIERDHHFSGDGVWFRQ